MEGRINQSNVSGEIRQHQLAWAATDTPLLVLTALLVPLILASNFLVVASVARFRRLHTPTNFLLASLSLSDIFIGLLIPVLLLTQIKRLTISNIYVCLIPHCAISMGFSVSVLSLGAIAFDRYTAIQKPFEYISIVTNRRTRCFIAASWVYSLIVCLAPFLTVIDGNVNAYNNGDECSFFNINKWVILFWALLTFLPSCVCIFICYLRIFYTARRHAHAISAIETSLRKRLKIQFIRKDARYAKTLAIVISVFLILCLPIQLCNVVHVMCDDCRGIRESHIYLTFLAFLNSALNPWIYAYKNLEFRAAFKRWCTELCSTRCEGHGLKIGRRDSQVSTSTLTRHWSVIDLSRTNSRSTAMELLKAIYAPTLASASSSAPLGLSKSLSVPNVNKIIAMPTTTAELRCGGGATGSAAGGSRYNPGPSHAFHQSGIALALHSSGATAASVIATSASPGEDEKRRMQQQQRQQQLQQQPQFLGQPVTRERTNSSHLLGLLPKSVTFDIQGKDDAVPSQKDAGIRPNDAGGGNSTPRLENETKPEVKSVPAPNELDAASLASWPLRAASNNDPSNQNAASTSKTTTTPPPPPPTISSPPPLHVDCNVLLTLKKENSSASDSAEGEKEKITKIDKSASEGGKVPNGDEDDDDDKNDNDDDGEFSKDKGTTPGVANACNEQQQHHQQHLQQPPTPQKTPSPLKLASTTSSSPRTTAAAADATSRPNGADAHPCDHHGETSSSITTAPPEASESPATTPSKSGTNSEQQLSAKLPQPLQQQDNPVDPATRQLQQTDSLKPQFQQHESPDPTRQLQQTDPSKPQLQQHDTPHPPTQQPQPTDPSKPQLQQLDTLNPIHQPQQTDSPKLQQHHHQPPRSTGRSHSVPAQADKQFQLPDVRFEADE